MNTLQERDAKDIEIPNIRWDVFELMMRYSFLYPLFGVWKEMKKVGLVKC